MNIPENAYERVKDPADPERCQSNTSQGQCLIKSLPGTKYCILHKGTSVLRSQERESMNRYRLGRWQERVKSFGESDAVKSLRDEIGILRMMLEERFQTVKDSTDLLLQSHTISEMILKIERVVLSCHKIEKSMGQLIDHSQIMQLTEKLLGHINEVLVDHPEKVKEITDRFEESLHEEED